ncbi:MAG TPA: ABC transporter ATP-binding protein [Bacteroidota bacterium]|nr:ABC transporter ATP-binding protein [Bacteroidota bacterium]
MTSEPWLRAVDLCRFYKRGPQTVHALAGVTLDVGRGEFLGIVGASGSGKSTLLNLLAGLDTPTSGFVQIGDRRLSVMSRKELSRYRACQVGMIFQSFNLIAHYTALQNVETALVFNDVPQKERRTAALAILGQLGLADRVSHRPADLSGGEQQRVAVARAIVKKPSILFADEPTGNLDYENSMQIAELLRQLNHSGLTVVMVTHNLEMANAYSHRIARMQYGKMTGDDEGMPQKGPRT